MNNFSQLQQAALKNIADCGLAYKSIDVSAADHPTSGVLDTPFRSLNVGVAGNVAITGLNGATVTLYCNQGHNPYGGIAVKTTGTTAEQIRLVY